MTSDREPDLDNANVGMPDFKFRENARSRRSYQIGSSFFYFSEVNEMVKINGEHFNVAGVSVEKYLIKSGYDIKRVAVELNGDILPKAQYENIYLNDGDCVEIVSFVGGG